MKIVLAVAIVLELVVLACAGCKKENWWKCFDQKGFCRCTYSNYYMNGLWRNHNDWKNDYLYKIEEANCCGRTWPFYNQPSVCIMGDWWYSFDRSVLLQAEICMKANWLIVIDKIVAPH